MTRTNSDSPFVKIASYTEILAKEPRSTVFVPLAETYRQIGMLPEAFEVAMKGVRVLPDFSPGYTVLGRIQAQKGDLSGAALSLEKALAIDAGNVVALKSLARIRQQQGDIDRALKLLERVATVRPDDESIKKMRAKLLDTITERQKQSALNELSAEAEEASGRGKSDPLSTQTIAELYIRQGFPRRALKVYRDLLRLEPTNEEVRKKLIELKNKIAEKEATPAVPEEASERRAGGEGSVPEKAEETASRIQRDETSFSPLDILNRWLEVIQNRRAHV